MLKSCFQATPQPAHTVQDATGPCHTITTLWRKGSKAMRHMQVMFTWLRLWACSLWALGVTHPTLTIWLLLQARRRPSLCQDFIPLWAIVALSILTCFTMIVGLIAVYMQRRWAEAADSAPKFPKDKKVLSLFLGTAKALPRRLRRPGRSF